VALGLSVENAWGIKEHDPAFEVVRYEAEEGTEFGGILEEFHSLLY
jgi:hypothetical protein